MTKHETKSSKYHLVWTPKYRKSYLTGNIKNTVEIAIIEKCEELKVKLMNMQVMPDHIHLFVSIPLTISISNVVNQLKGYSSYKTRKTLKLYKYKAFWGVNYFCESVGHISELTIRRYIDNQWMNYHPNSSPP